ncbi:MAG: hypothetical protein HYZ73_01190 [Elusimicrobia bacterium]|nr:hypothetical protein [Elusimicrobiota bacterium]
MGIIALIERLNSSLRRQSRGQGLVEYILVVALIALLAIGAIRLFGRATKSAFQQAAATIQQDVLQGIREGKTGGLGP